MSLPNGYKRLKYIATTGEQYIDTGASLPSGFRAELKFECSELTEALSCVIGSHNDFAPFGRNFFAVAANYFEIGSGDEFPVFGSAYAGVSYDVEFSNISGNVFCKINGVDQALTITGGPTYSAYTVHLFNLHGGEAWVSRFNGKLEFCRIYSPDGELVRDYIPCITDSGEVGLWDDVNSVFYGNAGTGTFTAGPEMETQTIDANTLLLLHGKDLIDSSPQGLAIANSGVSVSPDQSKFGGKSLYFNGQAYLKTSGATFDFGTGDFTVDFWAYWIAGNGGAFVSPNVTGGMMLGINTGTSLNIGREAIAWDGGADLGDIKNRWVHIAVVRSSGVLKIFLNGELKTSFSNANTYSIASGELCIGVQSPALYGVSYPYIGYIDEYRISNVARWTQDFAPPDEPYSYPAPSAPTALKTVLSVALQWAASANADSYDVYRDGAKLGSTTTTQYVDTTAEANQTYVYTVRAANGGGESDGTSITVYTRSGFFEYKPAIESANFR